MCSFFLLSKLNVDEWLQSWDYLYSSLQSCDFLCTDIITCKSDKLISSRKKDSIYFIYIDNIVFFIPYTLCFIINETIQSLCRKTLLCSLQSRVLLLKSKGLQWLENIDKKLFSKVFLIFISTTSNIFVYWLIKNCNFVCL